MAIDPFTVFLIAAIGLMAALFLYLAAELHIYDR